MARPWLTLVTLLAVTLILLPLMINGCNGDQRDILDIAYSYPDGGGFCGLDESGVPEDIVFKGTTILRKSTDGSYCCGYTLAVALRAAEQRGLLEDVQPYQIARFQREWYGSTSASRIKQLVAAMENLGIGREIHPQKARPGDFVVFSRANSGHSVVFLEWISQEGKIVGLRYRSSQPGTKGIGDNTEYFTTSGYAKGTIIPKWTFVGRLK